MSPKYRLPETPAWAGRLIRAVAAFTFALILAMLLPSLRCESGRWLVASFGTLWILVGAFTWMFDWALPLRGGGYCSPTKQRWKWLTFCCGTTLTGSVCLLGALGVFPLRIAGCT